MSEIGDNNFQMSAEPRPKAGTCWMGTLIWQREEVREIRAKMRRGESGSGPGRKACSASHRALIMTRQRQTPAGSVCLCASVRTRFFQMRRK